MFFGNLGVIRVIGFFMLGEEVLVFWVVISCCMGFLGGELFLNFRVILVFVKWLILKYISVRYLYCKLFLWLRLLCIFRIFLEF